MSRLRTSNRIKYCSEPSCGVKFIYLLNPKTLKYVPVNYDTLTSDESSAVEGNVSVMIVPVSQDSIDDAMKDVPMVLCYSPEHHVSHFKTCTKPNLFSSSKKKEDPDA